MRELFYTDVYIERDESMQAWEVWFFGPEESSLVYVTDKELHYIDHTPTALVDLAHKTAEDGGVRLIRLPKSLPHSLGLSHV